MIVVNEHIEHTNLKPILIFEDIERLVNEAEEYNFLGICVPPYWVKTARREIGNKNIQLVSVVGFPLGYNRAEVKKQEIDSALKEGVDELDIVVNLSAIKTGNYQWVKQEMSWFSQIIHEKEVVMKVIIETAYLTKEEIKQVCKVCVDAGADFIKTSTGFAHQGATLENVKFLREILPSSVDIKASGGIKTLEEVNKFIKAGASRIGTSSGVNIMKEFYAKND